MANGTTTPAVGTTPATGSLNYADYQKRIQEAAARTRDVGGNVPGSEGKPAWKSTLANIQKTIGTTEQTLGGFGKQAGGLMRGLTENWLGQKADVEKKAERAASALEMVGSSTLRGVQNLEAIQGSIRAGVQNAAQSWDAAAEKADEYVKAARGRVGEVLTKLDTIFNDIRTTRDFSKAHAMQASVQAVTGSMRDEERNILQNYGADSKEYDQFRASKMNALGTIQSNIHATYAQLEEQQKTSYLNATADAYTKSNMYVGFQEQQHVETLKFRDENRNAYALKAAELDASLEQMKMSGMENLANWVIETPTFTMDATPLIAAISDLSATAANQYMQWKTVKRTTKGGGGKELLGSLLTAGAAGIGTAFGGPIGGALAGGATKAATGAGKAASSFFWPTKTSSSSANSNPANE